MAHFIGDWMLQPDSLALNKKKDTKACVIHIVIYMLFFLLVPGMVWWKFLLIAIQHFVLDRTHVIGWFLKRFGFKRYATPGSELYPMGYIMYDQLLHIIWIWIVMGL